MSPRDSLRAAAREVRSEVQRAGVWNSLVNAVGIVALVALHLWGTLPAQEAALGVLALCGAWAAIRQFFPR